MRFHEITRPLSAAEKAEIDRLCSPNTPPDMRAAIEDDWRRATPPCLSPEEMQMMYGHDVEGEELERRKLHAEVDKIEAEAARARAEATAAYRSNRSS